MPNLPLSIKFDFRHYIPDQNLSAGTVQLDSSDCGGDSFIVTLLVDNLIPGHAYRTNYELISPITTQNVFNPSVSDLFASFSSQNFVTSVKLPPGPKSSNSYILKATVTDITEGTSTKPASTQINLICGIEQPTFRLEMLDPDLLPVPPDNIIDIGDCSNPFPLVCNIKDAVLGKQYSYEFFGNPSEGIAFENKTGNIFAGDVNQNFNTKVALTGYPYVFVHASATEIDTGISRTSQPVLLKCFQTNLCDVVLPTGVNVSIDVPIFKKCANRGLTTSSISSLFGGQGFSIGDKLTTTGGGGFGAEIEILFGGITENTFSSFVGGSGFNIGDLIEVTGGGGSGGLVRITSGGLTNASITNLTGCSNFKVGDLLTTVGGGGSDALISVSATGVNGSISSYSIINPGYGYTNVPSGIKSINGNGSCVAAVFNGDNFTIPSVGGITSASLSLEGGSGYNIGEILNIVGGGGLGAQVKILSGSLTLDSINTLNGGENYSVGDLLTTTGGGGSDVLIRVLSVGNNGQILTWEILNGGHGFVSAPTGLINITGVGSGASLVANADNFSITSEGGITKNSINNLIGTGSGYSVGDELIAVGGEGSGAVLIITSVSGSGAILDFVIKNAGSKYTTRPTIISSEDQTAIIPQPTFNINNFTDNSYVVINSGSGYVNTPSAINSSNGNGGGASFDIEASLFTDLSFIVVNAGSGYTSSPTGIVIRSGDGSGVVTTFNDNNFTIPGAGGITYDSVNNLIGKSPFLLGEELVVDGGGGSGGRIKITGVDNSGAVTAFVILNAGSGYESEPVLKRLNGSVISGVSFDIQDFTDLAVMVINPGSGFFESPNGLQVLTGNGKTDSVFVQFNSNNFIELVGPNPTPSSTPTPTVTPSQSEPVRCNDLQTAGGQNTVSSTTVAENAVIGQNYIVVIDTDGLQPASVIEIAGVQAGTYITKVENFFANFDNRTIYKKLTISSNITSNISQGSAISIYAVDTRLIKVGYWPGIMNFVYDAYSVPDRFKVFAVPIDARKPDILLFDSGYRGAIDCGYATHIPGSGGSGSVSIMKPDGCIFIKVIVEAPCAGTAWEYSLSCPERVFTTITTTPTPTKTTTPTPSPTKPS